METIIDDRIMPGLLFLNGQISAGHNYDVYYFYIHVFSALHLIHAGYFTKLACLS